MGLKLWPIAAFRHPNRGLVADSIQGIAAPVAIGASVGDGDNDRMLRLLSVSKVFQVIDANRECVVRVGG